ncbi:MAG: hypothetical protein LBD17_05670 [Endomicrobium sp.]|jgi:hypothetical protein|nr:hypothetical protein [Endomicrobium sp.]
MKEVYLLSVIIVMFIVFSCGFKDKLMNNAISVTIKPGTVDSIQFNSSQEFTASIRDPRGKLMDAVPHWNISGFNSEVSISTNTGKNIVFYTGNTKSRGVLTAEYDGVRRFVNIEINNRFNLYKNGKLSDKIDKNDFLYGNGGNNPYDCITKSEVTDSDGEKCFELVVKQPARGNLVGFYLEFKDHEDLSEFTTLHVSMRSCDGNGNITFTYYVINETDDGDDNAYKIINVLTIGESFRDISIDISGQSRDTTKEILAIEFTFDDIKHSPRKVRLKNIYLE